MTADPSTILLAIILFASIIGGYLFIERRVNKQKQASDILRRATTAADDMFAGGDDGASTIDEEDQKSPICQTFDGILASAVFPLLGKDAYEEQEKATKQMQFAGIRSADAASYFLFFKYVVSIVLALIALPLLLSGDLASMVQGLLLAAIGLLGPKMFIQNAIDKRKKILTRSFPDSLDLMLVCVESGLAMDAAFARVCAELGAAHPEMTEELNRTRLELSLLNDRSKALYNMGQRTDITALKALAAALIQTEKFGTSLADTLRVMSDDFRQTRLMEAENKANRLPALMTLPLITMLLPALFIIILAPAIIQVQAQGGLFGGAGGVPSE